MLKALVKLGNGGGASTWLPSLSSNGLDAGSARVIGGSQRTKGDAVLLSPCLVAISGHFIAERECDDTTEATARSGSSFSALLYFPVICTIMSCSYLTL
jgi:hypothetical protein